MSYIKNNHTPTLTAEELVNRLNEEISYLLIEIQYFYALGYEYEELAQQFKEIEYKKDIQSYIIAFHNSIIRD